MANKDYINFPSIALEILLEGKGGAAQNAVREDYPDVAALVDKHLDLGRMTVRALVERCWSNAVAGGWADKPVGVPEQVALIHSEVSEALEAYRKDEPISWTAEGGKPEGIASEYADVVIRICHYCQLLGIDLTYELDRKLTYNLTRGHRHGGKRI